MDNTETSTDAPGEVLTEAQAEEVLGALAGTLQWEVVEGGGLNANLFKKDGTPNGYYYVSPGGVPECPAVRVSKGFWDTSVEAYPKGFASVAEGRAACELHYKTFKWEADLVWRDWPIRSLLAQKRAWLGGTDEDVTAGGRCYVLDQVATNGKWTAHLQTQAPGTAVVVRTEATQPLILSEAKNACERHNVSGEWFYPDGDETGTKRGRNGDETKRKPNR